MRYLLNTEKYIIENFYRLGGNLPPPPPVEKTYWVLQTPDENNPIDRDVTGTVVKNTLWKDFEHWDDDKYWFDTWNLEVGPQKYWVRYTYTNEPSDIDKPSDLQYKEGQTVYIGTQIIPGTTVIRDGYKYVFVEYTSDSPDVEIIHGDTSYDYHFIMPGHDVTLIGTFEKTPVAPPLQI